VASGTEFGKSRSAAATETGRSLAARLLERSRIVLRAADGPQNDEIAGEFGSTPKRR